MLHLKTVVIILVVCCCTALALFVLLSSSSSSQKPATDKTSFKSEEKLSTDEIEKSPASSSVKSKKNNDVLDYDISQHLPFVVPLPSSSDEASQSSHYYSASSIVKTIQTHLFKNFVKGHFDFDRNSQVFSSRSTEFKSNLQASYREDANNFFDFSWQPTSCLPKSTVKCSRLKNMGGPLKSLSPFLNFDGDNNNNNNNIDTNKSIVSGYCCGFAETGTWKKSFAPDAFEEFRSTKLDVASLIFNRLIWEDKLEKLGIDPRKMKGGFVNNNNDNKFNSNIVGARTNQEQVEDEIKQRLSRMGESAQSQQLLEELYTVLGRNFATNTVNDKLTLDQTRMMLFAAISAMKLVDVDVAVPASRSSSDNISKNYFSSTYPHHDNQNAQFELKKQKAVRIFITGNSYLRALISNIGAIMRNQERYFDRGTHGTIRYVFTNLGDYYWFDPGDSIDRRTPTSPTVVPKKKSTMKKEKVGVPSNNDSEEKSAPKPKKASRSAALLPPIILRSDKEVVFFEVVYNFQTGMHIANHEYSKKRSELSSMDYNLESPLMTLADQRRMFRGKFSGIFMRPFVIHSSGAFYKFFGAKGFDEYAKWQMETVMKYDDEKNEISGGDNDYLVAMHSSHPLQYLWIDQSRNGPYAKYELIHSKAAFEETRNADERNVTFDAVPSSRRRSAGRHVFIPYPGSTKTRERVTITDDLSHSNCILLPHFPFPANGFRHQESENMNKNNVTNLSDKRNKISSNNDNEINVKDCRDMLSRNYWFRFGFGALLSAPWAKRQFRGS